MDPARSDAVCGGVHGGGCLLDPVQPVGCEVAQNRSGEAFSYGVPPGGGGGDIKCETAEYGERKREREAERREKGGLLRLIGESCEEQDFEFWCCDTGRLTICMHTRGARCVVFPLCVKEGLTPSETNFVFVRGMDV